MKFFILKILISLPITYFTYLYYYKTDWLNPKHRSFLYDWYNAGKDLSTGFIFLPILVYITISLLFRFRRQLKKLFIYIYSYLKRIIPKGKWQIMYEKNELVLSDIKNENEELKEQNKLLLSSQEKKNNEMLNIQAAAYDKMSDEYQKIINIHHKSLDKQVDITSIITQEAIKIPPAEKMDSIEAKEAQESMNSNHGNFLNGCGELVKEYGYDLIIYEKDKVVGVSNNMIYIILSFPNEIKAIKYRVEQFINKIEEASLRDISIKMEYKIICAAKVEESLQEDNVIYVDCRTRDTLFVHRLKDIITYSDNQTSPELHHYFLNCFEPIVFPKEI